MEKAEDAEPQLNTPTYTTPTQHSLPHFSILKENSAAHHPESRDHFPNHKQLGTASSAAPGDLEKNLSSRDVGFRTGSSSSSSLI